jgi:Mlc titration factor MtfA (ptsG expression regulator)
MFGWLFRRRAPAGLSADGRRALGALAWVGALSAEERARLETLVARYVGRWGWEGCAGLVVTDEMRVAVAAQAARLAVGMDGDPFRNVRTVLVYPSAFVTPNERRDELGIVSDRMVESGEAWHGRGPVIVSWDDAREGLDVGNDGSNVLLHEFAHKLDMLDGWADGTPPMSSRAEHALWTRTMTEEFERLRHALAEGRAGVLRDYAATNPAEFFAVATEAFFERPDDVKRRAPALYERLAAYYRQDPASAAGR